MKTDLVFDTGALVALQRDLSALGALLKRAFEKERRLVVSAAVLAEFLGYSPRRLRASGEYVASHFQVADATEEQALRAALLIRGALNAGGKSRPSAVDALAAALAETTGAALVYQGDRPDFEALAAASDHLEIMELSDLV